MAHGCDSPKSVANATYLVAENKDTGELLAGPAEDVRDALIDSDFYSRWTLRNPTDWEVEHVIKH